MKSKMISKTEIAILVLLAILLIVLWTTAFGNDTLDLTLHDTYLVIKGTKEKIFVFPMLLLLALVYAIKEAFYGYQRSVQNIVMLTAVFLINICLLSCVGVFHIITSKLDGMQSGWTIYPPLSALPKVRPVNTTPHGSLFDVAWQILLIMQIIFLVILVIIAVITGKNWNHCKRET
ncbi:hypothetical protein [uncultured Mucilaginibacter sp.]|uniref:hypothetical protein n=1 Tax=uncultured Mucilaginibacter sp. TaxID=797541 RepID=UPI0025E64445|nr:hypothetical protein [uncultured Mucilaginibacter sp.]